MYWKRKEKSHRTDRTCFPYKILAIPVTRVTGIVRVLGVVTVTLSRLIFSKKGSTKENKWSTSMGLWVQGFFDMPDPMVMFIFMSNKCIIGNLHKLCKFVIIHLSFEQQHNFRQKSSINSIKYLWPMTWQ